MKNQILKRLFGVRREKDSFGYIDVPEDRLWGAQTQRSLENFKIGKEKMPEGKNAPTVTPRTDRGLRDAQKNNGNRQQHVRSAR